MWLNIRHSLRGRLLLGTLIWVLMSVFAAGWALTDLFRQQMTRQLSAELSVHMNQLVAALSVDADSVASLEFDLNDPRFQQPFAGLYWQIDKLSADGPAEKGIFHSRSLWDETLDLPHDLSSTDPDELLDVVGPLDRDILAQVRVVIPPEGSAAYRLIVAADEQSVVGPVSQFLRMLAIFLAVLAFGLVSAALLQVMIGLKPLVRLRRAVADVHAGRAHRIQGRFPSEVQPLVDEFNGVLQNHADMIERARTQAGNLAHALKTPLSVLGNAAAQERTAFGRLVAAQVQSASRQVQHHLARARAAAAMRTPGLAVDVAPVVQGLERVLQRLYQDKNLAISVNWPVEGSLGDSGLLAFRGEEQDLQEMLGNVMDNACQWASRRVWITVKRDGSVTGSTDGTATTGDRPVAGAGEGRGMALKNHGDAGHRRVGGFMEIRVEDDGPGLSAAQQARIFDRGVRLDERAPGSGLGLSIVRDLVTAYGGTVEARGSLHGGLCVILRLPRTGP